MNDLKISITHDGVERTFPLSLIKWGYTYRVQILIEDVTVLFEPDEEGSYRALMENGQTSVKESLLVALAQKLESIRD